MPLTRRDFLWSSASLAAVAASEARLLAQNPPAPAAAPGGRGNPMNRLNVAVIGFRGRGREHLAEIAQQPGVVVTHVCDVDTNVPSEERVAAQLNATAAAQGNIRPEYVQDLRRILDNRSIDCVTIATPNHWHSLAAIWALQAGKHVYVEKPVSHNVWEGRRLVDASRHFNKICQAGTQNRSSTSTRAAIEFLRSGRIGEVQIARALCYKRRPSIGTHAADVAPPATVNYDIWCGPAPNRPTNRTRFHYDWHWQWDYGNGDLGNQGIHQMDIARWGLGKNTLCSSIWSVGGRLGYVDDGETPNTQLAVMNYDNVPLLFEVRGLQCPNYAYREGKEAVDVGNVFHCTNGTLVVTNRSTAVAYNPDGEVIQRFQGSADHFANFFAAVRANRREMLTGDILEGHLSSALCHLANISYRLGQPAPFAPPPALFANNATATEAFGRMTQHLTASSVNLDRERLRVGPLLTLNVSEETFRDNAAANLMLTREYRRGFEVPARF